MNRNRRKTKDEFITDCEKIHGNRYSYDRVNYLSNRIKIEIICKIHGSFLQTPKSHLNGSNCTKCSLSNKKYYNKVSKESFINKSILKYNNKFNYDKVNFVNMHTDIIIICPIHDEYKVSPSVHLKHGCKKCYYDIIGKSLKKDITTFIIQSSDKHNNFYDYSLSTYIGNNKKISIICPKHGIFNQSPARHLSGQGCPTCRKSKGEKAIESFLIKHNIRYTPQNKFNDCRNINPLPFDFYLSDYNVCIEYDGKQHFAKDDRRSIFYNTDIIINDEKKNKYCLDNNISLLRIHYKDYNRIEKILYDKMNQYKKITQEEKNEKFIIKSKEIFGYRYDYSKVNYVDSHTHVIIIYNGKEYKQTPIKHLQGKKIENTIKKISTYEFIEKSKLIWGNDRFNYSECEYLGTNNNIKLFDNIKNKWITQVAKSHLKGFEVAKYDRNEFINICLLIYDGKYNYDLIEYKSLMSRINIKCPEHGYFKLKSSSHLLGGSHCPKCRNFDGEKEISKFLNKYNITHNRQHKFNDCKNIHPLPFDFYIPGKRTCIEFDGQQHFQPIEHFGGLSAYEFLKINDKIKEEYCEENYINLIRIRYDQYNDIYQILWNNLKS